jgi:catechol 2,3-dioxygenase-like lactoylglutathione lyase family enzyme
VLYGRDPERSGAFYEKLGLRAVAIMEPFAVMELRGGTHLVVRRDANATGGPAEFDLMVEDLEATRASWDALGISVSEIGVSDNGLHRTFTVTDPDGNAIVVNDSHVVGVV